MAELDVVLCGAVELGHGTLGSSYHCLGPTAHGRCMRAAVASRLCTCQLTAPMYFFWEVLIEMVLSYTRTADSNA